MGLYTARVSAVTLSASTTATLLQIVTGANRPAKIIELGLSFDGIDASHVPVQVDMLRQTTAGTSVALTLVKEDTRLEAAQATALKTFTAEPTASDVLRSWYVTPANGLWVMQFPLGREPVVVSTDRLGIRAITPSVTAPKVCAYLTFEE